MDIIKNRYINILSYTKLKMIDLNAEDEVLVSELHRFKKYEKNVEELFKSEMEKYKITEDSMTEY